MLRFPKRLVLSGAGCALVVGILLGAWALATGSSQAEQGSMHNCPQPGKWAISVWEGPDGTETGQALATCGAAPVIAAYYLDPASNGWLGYFEGRPEATQLLTLNYMQGVLALGGAAVPTPTPTGIPTPTLGAVSAKEGYPLALAVATARDPGAYLYAVKTGCNSGPPGWCFDYNYDDMAPGDGRSTYWHFYFHLPGAEGGLSDLHVPVADGLPGEDNAILQSYIPDPLPLEEMIDSTEAVSIADANGGSAYNAASPGNRLCGAEIDPSSSEWHIDYCPPFEERGKGFGVWVDGRTGQVTKTDEPEWH